MTETQHRQTCGLCTGSIVMLPHQFRRKTRKTSLSSASYVRWQRGTARIRPPHVALLCAVQQSIDISCRPGHSRDRQTGWRRGVVVSGVRQWTKLTHVGPGYNWDGWPSSGGYTISGYNQPTRSTQLCIPPGSLNRVPASAGVKAGMSPLPGGW